MTLPSADVPSSIFQGVDALIDASLGLTPGSLPGYTSKSRTKRLVSKPSTFNARRLLTALFEEISENWSAQPTKRNPSQQNWRWKKNCHLSFKNTSPEKILEKRIASNCGLDWVNQVPTASGLLSSTSEKHCNIDLVCRMEAGHFEFIELKVHSDNPVYAAFEIVKYGLLYAFSRRHMAELGYTKDKILLAADYVTFCVMAPYTYYSGYQLGWLQDELESALRTFEQDCQFAFRFDAFGWPSDEATAIQTRTAAFPREIV